MKKVEDEKAGCHHDKVSSRLLTKRDWRWSTILLIMPLSCSCIRPSSLGEQRLSSSGVRRDPRAATSDSSSTGTGSCFCSTADGMSERSSKDWNKKEGRKALMSIPSTYLLKIIQKSLLLVYFLLEKIYKLYLVHLTFVLLLDLEL